ncbi:hypothetical protein CFY87_05035 [Actinobacillus seminis]|uniref:Trimeric autotransporter adhesin YadA-like head domain-containing protein n=1 Tax=Actinobacillus seminis TaxID=722 RepID=A0ABX4FMK2_9PAST|nr:hypothetical protein [Actinobacillus seminis]OZN25079.1 hypothetical protein CFY87_05035 [Actinobacillus seminis]
MNIYEGESDYLTLNQFLNQNLPEALAKENVQSWFKPKMELQEGSGEYKIIQAKNANVKILADGSSSYDMEYLGNTQIPKRIDYSKGYVNNGAIAIGSYVTARGDNSLAIGRFAFARDDRAFAIGQGAYGGGRESFAIGYGTKAIGPLSVALGALSRAEGINSFAIGGYSSAYGNNAMVIGYKATSEEGRYVVDNDNKSPDRKTKQKFEAIENTLAIGNYSNVNKSNSIALGFKSKTDYNPDDLKNKATHQKAPSLFHRLSGRGYCPLG